MVYRVGEAKGLIIRVPQILLSEGLRFYEVAQAQNDVGWQNCIRPFDKVPDVRYPRLVQYSLISLRAALRLPQDSRSLEKFFRRDREHKQFRITRRGRL